MTSPHLAALLQLAVSVVAITSEMLTLARDERGRQYLPWVVGDSQMVSPRRTPEVKPENEAVEPFNLRTECTKVTKVHIATHSFVALSWCAHNT